MKKKGISLVIGVAAVGCLCGAYFLLKNQNEKAAEQEQEAASGETILELDSSVISAISFETSQGTCSFVKKEDVWKLESDETFPVDEDALLSPLSQLEELKAVRTLTEVKSAADFGLEQAQNKIFVTDTEGTTYTLTIGDTNESTGDDYLMMNEDPSVIYTIDSAVCSAFSTELYDYAYSEELPVLLAADISGVEIQRDDGGYRLYLEDAVWKVEGFAEKTEDKEGGNEGTDAAAANSKDADADAVNDALSGLSNLEYAEFIDHNCTDLAAYGLDEPTAVITISYLEEVEAESEAETELAEVSGETEAIEEAVTEVLDGEMESAENEETEELTDQETETEIETEEMIVTVEHTLTFAIGAQDAYGDYYVQKEDSSEVHTLEAEALETFLYTTADSWKMETEETAEE